MKLKFLGPALAAALLAMTGASFAQYTQPGSSAGAPTSRCDSLIGTEKERCLREEGSAGGTVSGSATTGSSTPSVTPSDTPSVTPSDTPSVTPSATPSVTPSATPSVGASGSAAGGATVGGLSKCENMLGSEKEKCLQDERGGTGSTSGRAAGAGGSHAPGSTGTGAGTMGPQNTAPSGSVR